MHASTGGYPFEWTFGGGRALMLQIGHRESHDIDIFIDDQKILGFLDPAKTDLRFITQPAAYGGDGARFQRFAFDGLGEIDFIFSANLTSNPSRSRVLNGRETRLETVAEIIAKKVYYRGGEAKPRDIFDIAAAASTHRSEITIALQDFPDQVQAMRQRLERLNPAFVATAIAQLMILPEYAAVAPESLDIAKAVLRESMA